MVKGVLVVRSAAGLDTAAGKESIINDGYCYELTVSNSLTGRGWEAPPLSRSVAPVAVSIMVCSCRQCGEDSD